MSGAIFVAFPGWGGDSPNQNEVGDPNRLPLEEDPHFERGPDQFYFFFFVLGGGLPNKNEVDGPNRIPFKREPPFERCPDPFLHRFHVEGSKPK